jgi:hypothetical protein
MILAASLWACGSSEVAQEPEPRTTTPPVADVGNVAVKKLATGKIGLEVIPRNYENTTERWADSFERARTAGVQVVTLLAPAIHEWRDSEIIFATLKEKGYSFEMSYDVGGALWHSRDDIKTPGLEFKGYSDPGFRQWYLDHFTKFAETLADKLTYLTFHAEGADGYFDKYPKELPDYAAVMAEAARRAKARNPALKVGVYVAHHVDDKIIQALNGTTDFWPIGVSGGDHDTLQKPSDLEKVLERHIRLAGTKKIAVQEGAWSTSRRAGHSEEQQAEFVREVFRLLRKHRDRVEYFSFYVIYDESREITAGYINAAFPWYPRFFKDKIIDDLTSMGFLRNDGTPKLAWFELKKQIKEYYASSK